MKNSFFYFLSILSMLPSLGAMAAPVVVQPGSSAGYLYFPGGSGGSSGSGNGQNITVNVNNALNIPTTIMQPEQAGTCATATTIGQTCEWSDKVPMRYAGVLGYSFGGKGYQRKLFAHDTYFYGGDPKLQWGCSGISIGSNDPYDGLANTNNILKMSYFSNNCNYSSVYFNAPTAAIFCQSKNMYIPSYNELLTLYGAKNQIVGFENTSYLSSNELGDSNYTKIYFVDFRNGQLYSNSDSTNLVISKGVPANVRCVRSIVITN